MKKDRSNLPIIDLNLDEEFTKNSNKLLRDLLEMFIEEVPDLQQEINEAFHSKQKSKLNDLLHKFLSSCVYCGLLRLKESLIALKESINNNNYSIELLNHFNKEIETALEEAKKI
ncbi:MAG: Hpt domain-containing protein [Pseudomonadota bacterium]